jgi:hypothetical protein
MTRSGICGSALLRRWRCGRSAPGSLAIGDRLLADAFWKADMLRRLNPIRTCRYVNTAIQKSGLSAVGTGVSFPE